jgi:hypothetical protein
MQYNSNFKYDLAVGKVAEEALGDIFENKKVEVKTDFKAKTTGNLFIEFKSRGKDSGISTTQADYWCFKVENLFLLIATEDLRVLIEPLKGTNSERTGGDKNTSVGVLLPLNTLINHIHTKK